MRLAGVTIIAETLLEVLDRVARPREIAEGAKIPAFLGCHVLRGASDAIDILPECRVLQSVPAVPDDVSEVDIGFRGADEQEGCEAWDGSYAFLRFYRASRSGSLQYG